jgi:hypothetical protein
MVTLGVILLVLGIGLAIFPRTQHLALPVGGVGLLLIVLGVLLVGAHAT